MPETLHRYAFVKNNPINLIDRYGFYWGEEYVNAAGQVVKTAAEVFVIDPATQAVSDALTFDTSFSTPAVNVPYVVNIPSASVNLNNKANINFDFTNEGYNLTGSDTATAGLVTPNNNYGAGATGDAALVKDSQGYHTGAGGAVQFQKNGQILYQNAGFVGDTKVLKALGANSANDYKKQRLGQLNQQVIQSIKKAKDERTRRFLEIQKHLKDLDQQKGNQSPVLDIMQSPPPTLALTTVGVSAFPWAGFGGGGAAAAAAAGETVAGGASITVLPGVFLGAIISILPWDVGCAGCGEPVAPPGGWYQESVPNEQSVPKSIPVPISTPATPEPPQNDPCQSRISEIDSEIKSLEKGVESIQQRILEHQDKIANPLKYLDDPIKLQEYLSNPYYKEGLINYWEKEISSQQNEIIKKTDQINKLQSEKANLLKQC